MLLQGLGPKSPGCTGFLHGRQLALDSFLHAVGNAVIPFKPNLSVGFLLFNPCTRAMSEKQHVDQSSIPARAAARFPEVLVHQLVQPVHRTGEISLFPNALDKTTRCLSMDWRGQRDPTSSHEWIKVMSNVIDFRLPPSRGRRKRKDKRIKIGLTQEQLFTLDQEALRLGCSRSDVLGGYLSGLIETRQRANR